MFLFAVWFPAERYGEAARIIRVPDSSYHTVEIGRWLLQLAVEESFASPMPGAGPAKLASVATRKGKAMIGSYSFIVAILGIVVWSVFLTGGSALPGKKHNLRMSRAEMPGSSSTTDLLRSSKVPAGGSKFTISTNTGVGVSSIAHAAGRYVRIRATHLAKGFDMNSHAAYD